jgi:hypothetical protein
MAVALAKPLKAMLEFLLVAAEKGLLFTDMFFGLVLVRAAQEIHRHRWDDGSGPTVGRKHSEANRFGQWYEEEFRNARKKKHGKENNANAERGNKRRHGNLLSSIEDGLDGFLAHGQVSIDVLDFHGGVVHQDADGQR